MRTRSGVLFGLGLSRPSAGRGSKPNRKTGGLAPRLKEAFPEWGQSLLMNLQSSACLRHTAAVEGICPHLFCPPVGMRSFLHDYRRISTFGAGISQTARGARVIFLAIHIRNEGCEDSEEDGNNKKKEL